MESEIEIYIVIFFTSFVLFFAGVIALFLQYKNKRALIEKEKLLIQQQHKQELLKAEFEIQQQTMQEIGREIHDNVGQKLTLASLYTQQLDFDKQYPQIHDRINSVSHIINESLQDLRALSKSLTSSHIENQPLKLLLETEMEKVAAVSGFSCDVQINAKNGYSTFFKTLILRIVQEFFQNSIKHAAGNRLTLQLNHHTDGVLLQLSDNGKGFDYAARGNYSGIGLKNIEKRAALVGGELSIGSTPGEGTFLKWFISEDKL